MQKGMLPFGLMLGNGGSSSARTSQISVDGCSVGTWSVGL